MPVLIAELRYKKITNKAQNKIIGSIFEKIITNVISKFLI